MTRTHPHRADSMILRCLRPAGGWLFVLMLLALLLPTAWSFAPTPPGREILLEPATAAFGVEFPSVLSESSTQKNCLPSTGNL